MTNPYAPPPTIDTESRKFRLEASVRSARGFASIGLMCGLASGVLFELIIRRMPFVTLGQAMLGPGLILGCGMYYATRRNVPHARKRMPWLFPLFAMASFGLIGMMYAVALNNFEMAFGQWVFLCQCSVPGIVVLVLGCLLVARPRSYFRFALFAIITLAIVGVAPMFVQSFVNLPNRVWLPVFLIPMFVTQAMVFAMIGWIFGDIR